MSEEAAFGVDDELNSVLDPFADKELEPLLLNGCAQTIAMLV